MSKAHRIAATNRREHKMIDFELYTKTCKALRDSIQSWNESQKQQATLADTIACARCKNALKKELTKYQRSIWEQATEAEKDKLIGIDFPDRGTCFPYQLK